MGIPEFLDSGRNSWTLYSLLWTLDPGRWMLNSGCWALEPISDFPRLNYRKFSKDHGHACFVETIVSDVAIFRNFILTLSVTLQKNAERNFYCKKSNYITRSYLGLF